MGNPIFREEKASSKIEMVVREIKKLKEKGEEGIKYAEITGQVTIKDRGGIVEDFNRNQFGPPIMLLSLSAGGVGLNLVGANHLFLLDMHWNPQLENQACDRIYRVGQKKEVKIHKFLVKKTVEERINDLQRKKLDLADSMLSGAKVRSGNKLSLDELKTLFDVK